LTTEPEENTMLNKVVVFVIFGPKCISMLQNILTNPLLSHGLLWWCLYFLSGQSQ